MADTAWVSAEASKLSKLVEAASVSRPVPLVSIIARQRDLRDLESAVFGQYVRHLAKIHPDAPPPAVFADEPILENADDLRAKVGDVEFFAQLSAGAPEVIDGWGDLGAVWDAPSYDSSRRAEHGTPDRIRLVQAVLTTWLTSFAEAAQANRSGYVAFEDGLSAISHHALPTEMHIQNLVQPKPPTYWKCSTYR